MGIRWFGRAALVGCLIGCLILPGCILFNDPPIAGFTIDRASNYSPRVRFDAREVSYDPDGSIRGYAWSLGDGTAGTGPIVEHTYADPGSYSVGLVVTDNHGATDSVSKTVTVAAAGGTTSTTTDAAGETCVAVDDRRVYVTVVNEEGARVPGVTVEAFAVGGKVLVLAGSEDHYPSVHILEPAEFHPSSIHPKLAVCTIVMLVLTVASIGLTIYEYWTNPGEFPVQVPGLIEGDAKVRKACVQIDANDVISIGGAIVAGVKAFKAIQVLGAPAALRGVSAMNAGMTRAGIAGQSLELIGEKLKELFGILDRDILNTCEYYYQSDGGEVEMPYLTIDVQRPEDVGTLSGVVRDAVTDDALEGVVVAVEQAGTAVVDGGTDAQGGYTVSVPEGTAYDVLFAKTGYLPAIYHDVDIGAGQTTHLEAVLFIDHAHGGTGDVSGRVLDALTGGGVGGAAVELREGIHALTGDVVRTTWTSGTGAFSFADLDAGHYTAYASAEGYTSSAFTVTCVGGTTTPGQDGVLSPEMVIGETRIVLTWGETPADLDSHLTGPLPDGSRFHLYFPHADSRGGSPWPAHVTLDLDDTTAEGPETTTVLDQLPGTYRFSVLDYSNRNSGTSKALSDSGAQVRVFRGAQQLATFNVPANTPGTLWQVFELNGSQITPLANMSFESVSADVQAASTGVK